MRGYGRNPPHAHWPKGARVAVQFVINYEEGSENNILHGDAASEAFLSEIVGAAPWPGQRHMNMESIYEYGSRAGFWRLQRMFTQRNMPVTVFAVAMAMERNPDAVAAMKEAGWEIASHGLKWIDYRDFGRAEETQHIREAIKRHAAVTGEAPLGFYQGRTSVHTMDIVCDEQAFLYSADSYADDLPYWIEGAKGPQLVVPYTLDANDMRFATAQGFNAGEQFFQYLKDSFDVLYAEGASSPKMLSIGLHCRLVGRPGRAAALARFLDYIAGHEGAWVARRLDIARHWIKTHPPAGGYKPSRLSRPLFIELFGDVFEHSPHIAERTYARGLSAAQDTPDGLAAAFEKTVRAMSQDEKLALLRAHPELAGSEAREGTLTAASTGEQGRLGFNALSRAEFEQMQALNVRYRETFGFPFIAALARHETRGSVLADGERRIANAASDTSGAAAAHEHDTALGEVLFIAASRLKKILAG
jgi:chitin deacetylase